MTVRENQMTKEEVAQTLEDLLGSELALRRPSQGGLKPIEKKALRIAINELRASPVAPAIRRK